MIKGQFSIEYTDAEKAKVIEINNKIDEGVRHLKKPLTAYDHRSILQETERNQKAFNTYMSPEAYDPDFDWMADTVRPTTRNKIISIATAVTAKIIYPSFRAQNSQDEIDIDSAEVMRLISRWIIENSTYEEEYVRTVINALTDPVAYMETGFYEIFRDKRSRNEDGTINLEKVIDELMSGIQYNSVRVQEILFADLTITDIQKQPWIIKRKGANYDNAKQVYGDAPHWKHVKAGKVTEYNPKDDTWAQKDAQGIGEDEVLISVYYNRHTCEEIVTISGVLISEHDEPMKREDGLYPFVKTVYEEIQGLFTGKSCVNKIAPDQNLTDSIWNMLFDAGTLGLMPPIVSYGETALGPDAMRPGQVTHAGEEGSIEVLSGKSDIQAGLRIAQAIDQSMSESTQSARSSGVADRKEMTAVEYAGLEQNSLRALGLFGKQLSSMVKQAGLLMQGDIIQFITVPEITELISGEQGVKYKTMLANGNLAGGSPDMNRVEFTDQFLGKELVDQEEISMQIFEREGVDSNTKIHMVDPVLFRKLKFKVFISEEELDKPNKRLERALKLEAYDRVKDNPTIDIEAVTKDFLLEPYFPGESDKYIKKQQPIPQPGEQGQQPGTNLPGQITGSNSLKTLLNDSN